MMNKPLARPSAHPSIFDIVIPIGVHKVSVAINYTIPQLQRFYPGHKIRVVAAAPILQQLAHLENEKLVLLNEDHLIPNLSYYQVKQYLNAAIGDTTRTGWYFQQFIKLGIALSESVSNYYLVWDADCIPLKRKTFFDNSGRSLFYLSSENNEPYFITIKKALNISKQTPYSFITEQMLFDKTIVVSMINDLSPSDGYSWWENILNNIDPASLNLSGFCEYETYGNYVLHHRPRLYALRFSRNLREGVRIFGHRVQAKQLLLVALFFDSMSLENWHSQKTDRWYIQIRLLLSQFVQLQKKTLRFYVFRIRRNRRIPKSIFTLLS